MSSNPVGSSQRPAPVSVWQPQMWEETFGRETEGNLKQNWPAGVRIAVMLTFDTQGAVDAAVPGYQGGGGFWKDDKINYVDLAIRQYDVRCGVQRILRLLDGFDIKATFPVTGMTAEWHPHVVEMIAAAGHEVATHGYRHVQLFNLDEAEERAEIEAATEAVEAALGKRPVGWRSPMYSNTAHTTRILTECGYLYASDFHNDDMPYILENDGRPLVQVPAGMDDWEINLMKTSRAMAMGAQPYSAPGNVADILVSYFEMLYEESAEEPRVMQYCMHPKITGRPDRARALQRVIEQMRACPGVWFCTMEDVARLCL